MAISKNTGKSSEALFDNTFHSVYGLKAYVQPFHDAAYLHGLNRRAVKAPEQPADRMVTVNGETFYAEIKSVLNGTSLPFSMIKPNQLRAAKMQLLAGGKYRVFAHNLATDIFYIIEAKEIFDTVAAGKQSIRWENMKVWEDYERFKSR